MKKFIIILLTLILNVGVSVAKEASPVNRTSERIIKKYHIENLTDGNPFAFYCFGHGFISWSMIIRTDNGNHIFLNGRTTDSHGNIIQETKIENLPVPFDWNTIDWALDSLPNESKTMIPPSGEGYSPTTSHFEIVDSQGNATFEAKAYQAGGVPEAYTGLNAYEFNRRLTYVYSLATWLAMPFLHGTHPLDVFLSYFCNQTTN